MGAPLGSTSCSRSARSVAAVSTPFFFPPPLSNALSWLIALACLQFSQTSFHRIQRNIGLTCYYARASPLLGFHGKILSPLLLIEHRPHLLIGLLM